MALYLLAPTLITGLHLYSHNTLWQYANLTARQHNISTHCYTCAVLPSSVDNPSSLHSLSSTVNVTLTEMARGNLYRWTMGHFINNSSTECTPCSFTWHCHIPRSVFIVQGEDLGALPVFSNLIILGEYTPSCSCSTPPCSLLHPSRIG